MYVLFNQSVAGVVQSQPCTTVEQQDVVVTGSMQANVRNVTNWKTALTGIAVYPSTNIYNNIRTDTLALAPGTSPT